MNPKIRNLLAALTVLLLSAGVALAIVQPGDLGDDETAIGSTTSSTTDGGSVTTGSSTTETPTTETPTTETPTTDIPPTTPTSATPPTTDGTALPASTSTTEPPPTTIAGGGLGSSGGADAVGAGIANTGGDSGFFLVGAALLALLGLLTRRASRPTD